MKTIILDLTGCKSLWDIHERIRKAFDFPEWYGRNWSAFWDLLWSECDAEKVIVRGEKTLPPGYEKHLQTMYNILDRNIEFCKKYEKYTIAPFSYEVED